MEERQNEILEVALDRLEQEGMWFTTKEDKLYANAKDLYKLDKYGELEDKSKERLVKEVEQYFGDGAAFVIEAVDQWLQDNLIEGIIGYVDTLAMNFEIPEIIETIEAHDEQGVDDLDTTIAEEADLPEGVEREKKEEGKKVEAYNYYWEDDILEVDTNTEASDDIWYMVAENIQQTDPDYADWDVYDIMGDIISIWKIEKRSRLYDCLLKWYGSEEELLKNVRDVLDTNDAIYFVTGCGYSIWSADLLGGTADGIAKRDFDRFVENGCKKEEAKVEEAKGLYDQTYEIGDIEELKEIALNAIYVADNDAEIIKEFNDRNEDKLDDNLSLYGYVANNYTSMGIETLREIALNAIYVADNDDKIRAEIEDRKIEEAKSYEDYQEEIYYLEDVINDWEMNGRGNEKDYKRAVKRLNSIKAKFDNDDGYYTENKTLTEGKKVNVNQLREELEQALKEYMLSPEAGFDEEDNGPDKYGFNAYWKEYCGIDIKTDEDGNYLIYVNAELDFESISNLADKLNKVVSKYDKEAYFDNETSGRLVCLMSKDTVKNMTEGKKLEEDNDRDFEAFSKYIMDNVYCDSETLMTTPEIIEDNAGIIAEDAAKQVVNEILGETEYTGLYNSMVKDYEDQIKRIILDNIDRIVYLQNVEQEEVMSLLGEGKAKNLTEALNLLEKKKVQEVRVFRTLQLGDVYQNENGAKVKIIDVTEDKKYVTLKFLSNGEAVCIPMENANNMLDLNKYKKIDEALDAKTESNELSMGTVKLLKDTSYKNKPVAVAAYEGILDSDDNEYIVKMRVFIEEENDRYSLVIKGSYTNENRTPFAWSNGGWEDKAGYTRTFDITEEDVENLCQIIISNNETELFNFLGNYDENFKDDFKSYFSKGYDKYRDESKMGKSVNFNNCTKDKLQEGVRQRLEERNEQSAGVIEQALKGITDQTNEKESGIITKTSELFQQLSDRGYDVQVSFDNGESTSSIAIGQQGANVLITITDPEQPLRAFASGNFELNDDSVKMIKNILDVL